MQKPRFPVLWFFFFTLALTVVAQVINSYVLHRLSSMTKPGTPIAESPIYAWMPYSFYLINVGPSLVGLIFTFWIYRVPGVRHLGVQLTPWSVGRAWPVLAICVFLPLLIVVLPLNILGTPPDSWSLSTFVYGAVISGGLIGPGMCEELGWRGFALPQLQRHYSALWSSIIIGVVWTLWHWPNYFIGSMYENPIWSFVATIPIGLATAILYTWVYNSTGGSLFAVVILHGATASTPGLSTSGYSNALWVVPLIYCIIAVGLVFCFGGTNLTWREKVIAQTTRDSN